jgi:DNA ligase-1
MTRTTFSKLYSMTKTGSIRVWSIETNDDTITVVYGALDGASVTNLSVIKGVNIGRANETTPSEQAILEATAKHKAKKQEGYTEDLEGLQNNTTAKILLPMLANKFLEKQHLLSDKMLVGLQPKIDGIRMVAYWDKDELITMSRAGFPLNIAHIRDALTTLLPKNGYVDGELFIRDLMVKCAKLRHRVNSFQIISQLVKKNQTLNLSHIEENYSLSTSDLEYHVFDYVNLDAEDETYALRDCELFELTKDSTCIKKVPTYYVTYVMDKVLEHHNKFVAQYYEGTIIRTGKCTYLFGHRSNELLKYKDFYDGEFRITGFKQGKGTHAGAVIWECINSVGEAFDCPMTGTLQAQQAFYNEGAQHIGKYLTVKFQELTTKQIPRFPSGISIRDSWDIVDN